MLETGTPDAAEAVVFLHGQPGSADDWTELLAQVERFGRGVAFDWPGFGHSEKPEAGKGWDYSSGSYATFLAAVLWELGIERAHLVMHDLGGVGLRWGVAHPGCFASAVLIDTGVLLGFQWHWAARLLRTRVVGGAMARLTTRRGFRAFVRAYNPQPRELPDRHIDRWYEQYELNTRRAMLSFYRATPTALMERLREPLRRLDRPALVLWGAHDPAVPIEQAERQRESFPSAEVVVLEDSGHWPFLDDPEKASAAILPFLERQLARASAAAG